MPKPDADGRYKPKCDYSVNVGLSRGEKLIELRPIDMVICGEPEIELVDDPKPGEADIEALDSEGWDQSLDLGVVSTESVSRILC